MSTGTDVTYGTVTIASCQTLRFAQEAVYDDSGTDLLYQKFLIRVQGYIYNLRQAGAEPGPTNITPVNQANTNIAMTEVALRQLLMEPRQNFTMTVGGIILLQAIPFMPSNPQFADVNNGPKPRHCDIMQIAGNGSMRVQFEIEVSIKDCITDFNYSPVLNNRWSMTDEIDADWYTTRRVEGILVIAGTGNADDPNRLNVNMYRDWVVPKLQNGFKRESMRFQSSVDGLKLMYEIVDREVFASCPIPGTTWEGTYELSTGDGVQTFASINLRVQGPKNVDRAALINLILAIANQKLPNDKLVGLLRSAAIIEYMHQNAFEFRATMLMPMSDYKGSNSLFAFSNTTLGVPLDVQTRVIGFDAGNVPFVLNVGPLPGAPPPGAPPGAPPSGNYDSGVSPVPPPYGTVLQIAFGLFSPPLQSPCQLAQKTSELQPTNQSSPNQPPPQPPSSPTPGATTPSDPAVTFTIGAVPDDLIAESQYNIEQVNYSQYLIDAHYDNPTMVAMLPIAASPVSGSTPVVSAVFVQLAPPQCRRRVRITAERFNNWPLMPDLDVYRGPTPFIDSNGIMIVLLDEQLIPKAPQQAPSGADKIYSIEGEYLFGYSRKPDPANGDVLFTGSQPFLSSNLFESSVPPDIYETGIIE